MRVILQHHLNSLHIMARLTHLGVPRHLARRLARRWEAIVHLWLYGA
ncbi:MAG TPA: hypothetical protein VLT62_26455 [Candidatus Methylomirabilis sp.]|nr:hypothetical protein [Candidatus Methylomirabilis sp.]HSB79396.1 hypothetical protein [Candidatus Methylomirabilis sp.]